MTVSFKCTKCGFTETYAKEIYKHVDAYFCLGCNKQTSYNDYVEED